MTRPLPCVTKLKYAATPEKVAMKTRKEIARPEATESALENSDTSTLPTEPGPVNSPESSANSARTPRRGERRVDKRFRDYPADPREFLRWNTVYDYSPEFVAAEYNGKVRHWLNPLGFRFYAYQSPTDGRWQILDRGWDVAVTKPYRNRTKAIRAFNRQCQQWLRRLGVKPA